MSSAPAGLDVREYGYRLVRFTVPDGAEHILRAHNRWLVTRIQFFAPATLPPPGTAHITADGAGGGSSQGTVTIQPGGCVTLEPNGAYRGDLLVFGQGAIVIVEAWFQGTPDGQTPVVDIT